MLVDKLLLLLLCNLLTHNLSSCSGLSGLTLVLHHIYSQRSLKRIFLDLVLPCVAGAWRVKKNCSVIIRQFVPCWTPTAEMRMIISGQKQTRCICSSVPCALEWQSRHELVKDRKWPLCLWSSGAFASWISFHPAASQLYFSCQFPQCFCWYVNKNPFSFSFNKQSVQPLLQWERMPVVTIRMERHFLHSSIGSSILSFLSFYRINYSIFRI